LSGNIADATAVLLMMVGFGFKGRGGALPSMGPDAYEGRGVTAWIATGSKLASFVAMMKVFLHALLPWSDPSTSIMGPGWLGIIAIIAAKATMTYGKLGCAQRNLKRMLAYSSIAHAGYILVGVAAVSVSVSGPRAAGAVLYYLIVYAFANVGAFAVAAWLVRDKKTDNIDDLNGLGFQEPLLATCILVLMLSLIGIPPLAGFFGKLYVFMEALNQVNSAHPVTLLWLVALGLFNSVVSAFYYVRVLKAMFFMEPGPKRLAPASRPIYLPIVLGTIPVILFGVVPGPLVTAMQAVAVPMLTTPVVVKPNVTQAAARLPTDQRPAPPDIQSTPEQARHPREYDRRDQDHPDCPPGPTGPGVPGKAATGRRPPSRRTRAARAEQRGEGEGGAMPTVLLSWQTRPEDRRHAHSHYQHVSSAWKPLPVRGQGGVTRIVSCSPSRRSARCRRHDPYHRTG
jgi:NADH-quinone oxidoreductase subunit N